MKKPPVYTYEEAQQAMTATATAMNDLKKVEADQEKIILKAKEKYQPQVDELNDRIAEGREILTAYAKANHDQWPKNRLDLSSGCIVMKTNPEKVVLPDGKKEDEMIELLEKKFPAYVFQRTTIDRRGILDTADTPDGKKMLKATGITIVQDKTITIKPHSEKLQTA